MGTVGGRVNKPHWRNSFGRWSEWKYPTDALSYRGWPNEAGCTPTVCWAKAAGCPRLVDSDAALYETDEVPTLGLVGCSGDEGGRHCEHLVNAVLEEIAMGRKPAFKTWAEFEQVMIHRFKPLMQLEEARKI